LDVFKHKPGKCPQCGQKLTLSTKEQMKTEVVKVNTCPMHPDIALDKDGKCPKCGAAK
jgi:transcription initiation factor IIE alpha subunit